MSVERRFWTVDDIALLCAVVRNTKLSPDMIGLAIMLIFFILSVGFPGLDWGLRPRKMTRINLKGKLWLIKLG